MNQIGNSFRLNLFNSANKYFNFPRFKSTCVELKLYGGCSSAGQSTWLWPRRPWVQVPSLTQKFGVQRSPVNAPALGAGDREFESLYPDSRIIPCFSEEKPCHLMGLFIYQIYSDISMFYQKGDTLLGDTPTYVHAQIFLSFLDHKQISN